MDLFIWLNTSLWGTNANPVEALALAAAVIGFPLTVWLAVQLVLDGQRTRNMITAVEYANSRDAARGKIALYIAVATAFAVYGVIGGTLSFRPQPATLSGQASGTIIGLALLVTEVANFGAVIYNLRQRHIIDTRA